MIKTSKLFRNSFQIYKNYLRFANVQESRSVTAQRTTETTTHQEEIPVHLRPYDKNKYEVPSSKLKYATGYALLDVEPMPRSKIMKICYIILDKLKEIPAEAMYRIYTEEKLKYIMRNVDEIEDIRTLEENFGHDSIEVFIQALHKEIDLVDHMKHIKPWEAREEENAEFYKFAKTKKQELKNAKHERPDRERQSFVGNEGQSKLE